jgi:formylglycine-generating enzyme required for sulfatase activity
VSWNDAQEFIRKLNQKTGKKYRLPTEAEWEYAARGGNLSVGYKYNGNNDIKAVAWYNKNSGKKTHPVGTKQANELGIYDMSGNVWEWCSDRYGKYNNSSQLNPIGATEGSDRSNRVFRGGSWSDDARYVHVPVRSSNAPGDRGSNLGFRLSFSPGLQLFTSP